MSNVKVRITAQYYENYNTENPENPRWKAKGRRILTLEVDADYFFYGEEIAIQVVKEMLAEISDKFDRYEYVEHEIDFYDEIKLDASKFVLKCDEIAEKKYAEQQ